MRIRWRRICGGVAAVALLMAACGGGLSVSEYAAEVEALVDEMNGAIDQLDVDVDANPSLEATKRYASERVEAREDFVAGMRQLDPPEQITELHEAALRIMDRLTAAESALADRVLELDTNVGVDGIWLTPEGIAARTADDEAIAICQAAQAALDETQTREQLGDVPWVPPEMKEVVVVTFGCLPEDR